MAGKATTPPILKGPTAKEKKYDRQLRLWAASGQAALEDAKVLLLNSGPGVTGVETLKNLILPGVGSFTIVDEANVSESDLGVNFFLEESSLGRWRAEETCKFLQELNPEVKINALKGVWPPNTQYVADIVLIRIYSQLTPSPIIPAALSSIVLYYLLDLQGMPGCWKGYLNTPMSYHYLCSTYTARVSFLTFRYNYLLIFLSSIPIQIPLPHKIYAS